ncbi:MAG: hypothetical protein AAF266_11910 [Planctomycetota bacterium]
MTISLRFAALAAVCLCPLAGSAGVVLTANVYDTPGLPGYQTFDLTASSSTGYLNGFDFTKSGLGGITGPLHQGAAPSDDPFAAYGADTLFGGSTGNAADSHWLVNSTDGFAVQSSQSGSDLGTAFVFGGTSGLRDTYRSLPFARIVTNDPSAVSLNGEFLVEQYWSDGGGAGPELFNVSTLLSDVTAGPAPEYTTFPERPRPVFEPVITPPVVDPPTVTPDPLPEPPQPEPVDPITPPADPPTLSVDDYRNQLTDRQSELQRQIDALKAEQAKLDGLIAESEQPGFVPPTNVITIQPYPTRWPGYTLQPWIEPVQTIDVTVGTAIDFTVIDINDLVLDRSLFNDGFVSLTSYVDNDWNTDGFTLAAAGANALPVDVIPEPGSFALAALACVAVRTRRQG